jgi:diguanylate cyclase (GGDEF)-like protein
VAVIDLDEFKRYNDERGHLAGDALLSATALAWRGVLRRRDLLARDGGEEFAAVIPAWPLNDAVAVVDRLRQAMPAGRTCSAGSPPGTVASRRCSCSIAPTERSTRPSRHGAIARSRLSDGPGPVRVPPAGS